MALAETAKLIVDLSMTGNFARQTKAAEGALGKLGTKLSQTEGRAFRAGQQIGTGIQRAAMLGAAGIGILASQVALGLNSLVKLESATAQTEAVLKSTGAAAGITAGKVRELAEKFERMNATVGDETIQEAENLLLTFTNVRKEAFEPTLQAALDMNEALGKGPEGLSDTMRLLGKALNDPAKGMTALQRLGIRLTDQQKKQINAALKVNDTYGAQKVILDELDKRFGGSFLAGGGTTKGKVAKFTDSIEDLQRALATALLPTVGKVADKLSEFLADPKVIAAVSELGDKIAGLFSDKNIAEAGNIFKEVFAAAKAAAPGIAAAAQVTGQIVATAVSLFRSLPPEIQKLAIGALAINKLTGGLVTNIAGGLISAVLKQLVSGVVNVNGAVVNVNGPGIPGGGPAGPGAKPGGGVVGSLVKGAAGVTVVGIAGVAAATVAGVTRESDNRIINSQGNIVRTVSDVSQKIANLQNVETQLAARAAAGDSFAQQQLVGVRAELATLKGQQAAEAAQLTASLARGFGGLSLDERESRRQGQVNAEGIKQAERANAAKTDAVRAAVASAQERISAAARAAGQQSAAAIRDKDLSVTVNTAVSIRNIVSAQNSVKTIYRTQS